MSILGGRRPRIAVLATASPSGEQGGAERFCMGVRDALNTAGADASVRWEVNDESSFDAIKRSYLRFYDCDLTSYDGVISTKTPGYLVRHRNHVCYLQHTIRVYYDMFDVEFRNPKQDRHQQRELIHMLDRAALLPPRIRKLFTIGEEVRDRLRHYIGLESEVLYQTSTMQGLHCGDARYFFLPGRLHRWKRVGLAIDAMRHIRSPVELLISGTGENEVEFRAMAASDPRIRFLGRVSDAELVELYANALSVIFVPLREDFGLVTLEAFLSQKPVITCTDSGEPARMVRDGISGLVTPANPVALAAAMESLVQEPGRAAAMGRQGHEDAGRITWEKVGQTLMSALGFHGVREPTDSRQRGYESYNP